MGAKYDVFISYSHVDADIANKIYRHLTVSGLKCFIDRKGIHDSASWAKVLAESLNDSRIMLAVFSKAFNDSEQTDNEVSVAENRHIPILVFRITPDDFSGVKEYFLTKNNWIQAYPSPELHFDRLLSSIRILLGINMVGVRPVEIKDLNIFEDENLTRGYNAESCNDLENAAYYFGLAADESNPEGQYKMGMAHYFGHGVPQSWTKAHDFLNLAADSSHPKALEKLARMYHFGIGVGVDKMKALQLYTLAAELGSGLAMKALGKAYKTGDLGVVDPARSDDYYSKAFRRLHQMAVAQHDYESQFELANCYLDAEGVEYDANESIKWYQKAADAGFPPAINALGICYCRGLAVHRNLEKGYELQLKSAEKNCRIAQWNTAYNYFNACGVKENQEEGYNWMLKAANGGIAPAQCALGRYYLQGKNGLNKNVYQSKKWLKKAIESGSLDAMYILGHAYMDEEINRMPGDEPSFNLFKKAALNGHTPSYISLAQIYDTEDSEYYNPCEAVRWYEKIYVIFRQMLENDERHFVSSNGAGGVMFKELTPKYQDLFKQVLVRLSEMYCNGVGTEVDSEKAAEIHELSMEV